MKLKHLLGIGVAGIALLLAAGGSAFIYLSATPPIFADAHDVPAAEGAAPARFADAVSAARAAIRTQVADQNLPGVSVAVGAGSDLVWTEAFGWADVERRVPMTAGMRLRAGTASMVLTSVAAGVLVDQGRLDLDAEIQTYVPEFPRKPWPVTLRQLMAHTSGLRTDGGDEGPFDEHCDNAIESLRLFAERSLLFEPGTRFRESTYGWVLVSAAIERAAGEPFLRFIRRNVFEPAGMHDTKPDPGPDVSLENMPRQATTYFPRLAADPRYGYHLTRPLDLSCFAGAAVFQSTAADLVRFGLAVGEGTLVTHGTRRLLQTSERFASGEETGYGLGWDLRSIELGASHVQVVGHDGSVLGGPVVTLMTVPEHGLTIAVMSNASYADTFTLATRIAQAFAENARSAGH